MRQMRKDSNCLGDDEAVSKLMRCNILVKLKSAIYVDNQ